MTSETRIIIDGVDGIGKSTQCQLLARHLGFPIIRMPDFKGGDIEQSAFIFNNTLTQFYGNYIIDRGFISSLVYSKVMKRNANLSYIHDIKHHFSDLIILSSTKDEFTERQQKNKNGLEFSYHQLIEINETYLEFAFQFGAKVVNIRDKDVMSIHNEIKRLLNV